MLTSIPQSSIYPESQKSNFAGPVFVGMRSFSCMAFTSDALCVAKGALCDVFLVDSSQIKIKRSPRIKEYSTTVNPRGLSHLSVKGTLL